MKRYELIVIGAGPAGLSAAIEAASHGMKTVVFDENSRPGGQLFKQIHKFFGSEEHRAKIRGFRIGELLLREAEALGVEVVLNATVMGVFRNRELTVMRDGQVEHVKGTNIVIATGASENMLPFKGWTLPGVIGAGAAQTMMNLHGVKPGEKILMVGSGNVGLVVGYQLLQAGCRLEAIIDAAPRVGGYGVHAAKVARTGVPMYMSHTIKEAYGDGQVEGAVIAEVDQNWNIVPGSEKDLKIDTICLAVGLSPMSNLARMAGCEMIDTAGKGGLVPVVDDNKETSVEGIYAAGDVSGIEEASSAMIGGRIAGAAAAYKSGYLEKERFDAVTGDYRRSLSMLHEGMFAPKNKGKPLEKTDEGFAISACLLKKGYLAEAELGAYPGVPAAVKRRAGITPVIECTQNIPCNPCQTVCPKGCIKVGTTITNLPAVDAAVTCSACGQCVAVCPGQAIFLVDESGDGDYATVSIPYEFLPLPQAGQIGTALERSGAALGRAEVVSVKTAKAMDETAVLKIRVPRAWSMKARFFRA
jgi:thioredoxin reductase/Fe-S-cluster-containing hydrogenase component 2